MSEFLYVPNEGDNTVSVIDTADNSVIATNPVGGPLLPSIPMVRLSTWPA
jgi:YVTN family beta-propeller protein